ncbi:MAG TPA: 16S rRNA (adenine(1518)-N(6)/adenine(1519)-N(6))-dimethyltransferase RsmA [Bryobacteraceae bacterium]|nr:16S rRNA (adenine(1518)-N(6)/adenine(1519)-N(6))-dimethyltransferase RsmA [Bryobacteraceae bacterium]
MPRKLGQHFLVRDSILNQLAKAACGDHTARVIEIGPGKGALTRHLLQLADEVHVLELDRNLVDYLTLKLGSDPKLHIHQGDVLTSDLAQWGSGVVTGNLPYYITSPVLERFLALGERFPIGVFLIQWEVAQRLLAQPGTRDYGYLTVSTQLICEVRLITKVAPSAFFPPPKVDSGAVRLIRHPVPPAGLPALLTFVSRCFRMKRKTLRNNLRPFYGDAVDDLPESGLRAEQLRIDQFQALHAQLTARTGDSTPND